MTHRCGTVALLGRPNVGKSTLLNTYLKQKIAIVSPKPETTRETLLGILTLPQAQVLFIDTPGIYRGPKTLMAKHQIQSAREALSRADIILLITQASDGLTDQDKQIIKLLPRTAQAGTASKEQSPRRTVPCFLGINKVDRIKKHLLLPQMAEAGKLYLFTDIFPISATQGENIEPLLNALIEALPEGPSLYPEDQLTDKPARAIAQEIIREKALIFTHEEVPHSVAVTIEEWRTGMAKSESQSANRKRVGPKPIRDKRLAKRHIYIRANIYVERDSQKRILIGKEGAVLKSIGQAARIEIEKLVDEPVYLDLWIKVAPNWRKDPTKLRAFGY